MNGRKPESPPAIAGDQEIAFGLNFGFISFAQKKKKTNKLQSMST